MQVINKAGKCLFISVMLTNIKPSGSFSRFTEKVKESYYPTNTNRYLDSQAKHYNISRHFNPPASYTKAEMSGNTNNIAKHYRPINLSISEKNYLEFLNKTEKVELLKSNDIEKTHSMMIADEYKLIGYSEFLDRPLPDSAFKNQAEKLGAKAVVVSKHGASVTSYDELNNSYQYAARFYVKTNFFKNSDALGVQIDKIPLDKRSLYQRNTGAYVKTVIKKSRAYAANIMNEDVITAVNGNKILITEDFNRLKNDELKKNQTLNLSITRIVNDMPKELDIVVNFN